MTSARAAERIAEAEEALAHPAPVIAEEYASVSISIEAHLNNPDAHNGHTVLKNVWSTESAAESLLSQIDYFGQHFLLRSPDNVAMVAKATEKAAAIVYTVNDSLTNIIVDAALWGEVLDPDTDAGKALNPGGTVLGAHAAFITLAHDLKRAAAREGKPQNLLLFLSE